MVADDIQDTNIKHDRWRLLLTSIVMQGDGGHSNRSIRPWITGHMAEMAKIYLRHRYNSGLNFIHHTLKHMEQANTIT